jgi:hypothetical protein
LRSPGFNEFQRRAPWSCRARRVKTAKGMRHLVTAVLCATACVGTIGDGVPSGGGSNSDKGTDNDDGGDDPGGGDDNNPVDDGNGSNPGGGVPGTCPNDKFGIAQLYCTKAGGDEWFINMDNPDENLQRFNPKSDLTRNMDGSWKVTDTQVRMNVFTKEGYNGALITTYDQDELAAKGFMQSANDWKNVEITGYIKVNEPGGDDNFAWYARGGYHGNSARDGGTGCEGTCYKGDLYFDGDTRIAKEQWHNTGYAYTQTVAAKNGSIVGRWVGFKTVIYNTAASAVKVELYADWDSNNTWVKIDEKLDDKGFGNEGGHCGGPPDIPVTWGGPVATFRWDKATDVDFKNLSVREIQPPAGGA